MSKIVSAKKIIDCVEPDRISDVAEIRIYYVKDPGPILDSNNNPLPGIPYVNVPVVKDKVSYEIDLPGLISLTEGTWLLGVASLDAAGNQADVVVTQVPLDLTPPPKFSWRS